MTDEEPLSPAGVARREQIGRLAGRAAARRRWRRRAGRLAVAALIAGVAVPALWPHRQPAARSPVALEMAPRPHPVLAPAPMATANITYVETDPTIADRWSVRPTPPRWVVMGDGELLDALAAAGRPAGLIMIDGHASLLFREPRAP